MLKPDAKSDKISANETLLKLADSWCSAKPEAKLLLIEDYYTQLEVLGNSQQREQLKNLYDQILEKLGSVTEQFQDESHFSQLIATWHQKHPGMRLLLVIDQFEELLTRSQDDSAQRIPEGNRESSNQTEQQGDRPTNQKEWQKFLESLRIAIAKHPQTLRLVLTLRSDFEPRFLSSALELYWKDARFPVRAMTSDELRQAIENPALKQAIYFEELKDDRGNTTGNLVSKLVDEVGQMPGALPLLSFTLSELYVRLYKRWREEQSTDRTLRFADYEALGGVAGALTRRATEEYGALDEKHQATMRKVMLRMVAIEGTEVSRRRVPESELIYLNNEENQRIKKVIVCLVKARLAVKGQQTGEPYIEYTHDFLVQGWNQLQQWIKTKKEYLALQEQLISAVKEWKEKKQEWKSKRMETFPQKIWQQINLQIDNLERSWLSRKQKNTYSERYRVEQPSNFLWNEDPHLDLLKQLLNSSTNWLNKTEVEFVRGSLWKRRRIRLIRSGSITGVFLGLVSFIIYLNIQLQLTELREKSSRVQNQLTTEPVDALILAIDAVGQNSSLTNWFPSKMFRVGMLDSVQSSLLRAVQLAREKQRFGKHEGVVNTIAFNSDGIIVSGSSDGKIGLWNLQENLNLFEAHDYDEGGFEGRDGVLSVAFSPDGQKIVSSGIDGKVRLWDLNGEMLGELSQEEDINSVAFSQCGQTIVGGERWGRILLWNQEKQSLEKDFDAHDGQVNSVAFLDCQNVISAGDDGIVRIWDLNGNQIEEVAAGQGNVTSVVVSPDGQTIVSGGEDGTLHFWDRQLESQGKTRGGHAFGVGSTASSRAINSIAFTPDSKVVISAGDDGLLRLWNLGGSSIGQLLEAFVGHEGYIASVAIGPDGQTVVSGGRDMTVRLWDTEGVSSTKPLNHNSQVNAVAFSHDSSHVASGGADGTVRLWTLETFETVEDSLLLQEHNGEVNAVAFSLDNSQVASGADDRTIRFWNLLTTQENAFSLEHDYSINGIAFSPNSPRISSGTDDGSVHLWNLEIRDKEWSVPTCSVCGVNSIAFSPNGRSMISGHDGGLIKIFNLEGDSDDLQWSDEHITSVSFSPDGKWIIVGSFNRTVSLLTLEGEVVNEFIGHENWVNSVAFSPNSQMVVSGGKDGKVMLWDLQGNVIGSPLIGHRNSVTSVVFSPTGRLIASGSLDGTVRLWHSHWEGWIHTACNRLRRHPVFKNPRAEVERSAFETCQKYIWSESIFN